MEGRPAMKGHFLKQNWANLLFVGALAAVLVLGGLGAWLFPRAVNTYENRYAVQLPAFSPAAYGSGDFQDDLESALADQLPKASALKKLYHLGTRGYTYGLLSPLSAAHPTAYFEFYGLNLVHGDRLVYDPLDPAEVLPRLDPRIARIQAAMAQNPGTEFFLYYIEKDTDLNFETGGRLGAWEYLSDRLDLPTAKFAVDTPAEFFRDFYKTDHHWNASGSYRAYGELLDLLGCPDTPLEPLEAVTLDGILHGSKAAACGADQLGEAMTVFRFGFPAMTVTLDGQPAADYGNQGGPLSYSAVYGGDNGEVLLDAGKSGPNLLILGESYDNAVLKLLACHFGRVYAVDLRYYAALTGQDFSLSGYIQAHDIDQVLFMGNIDYFTLNDFAWES